MSNTWLGFDNLDGKPALVAVGRLKNYAPFAGAIIAAFDDHRLSIVLAEDRYHYTLDGRSLGTSTFRRVSGKTSGDWRQLLDAQDRPLLVPRPTGPCAPGRQGADAHATGGVPSATPSTRTPRTTRRWPRSPAATGARSAASR